MTIKQQGESLPVFAFRTQSLEAIRQNQLLFVVGETGSGKTTQKTQYSVGNSEAVYNTDPVIQYRLYIIQYK